MTITTFQSHLLRQNFNGTLADRILPGHEIAAIYWLEHMKRPSKKALDFDER